MKSFDAAIAGGGIIGASIALELAREGLRVGLFDRQEPGREASWASAGILSPAPENARMIPLTEIGKVSLALYPAFIANVEEISGHHTGFRPLGTVEAIFSRDARAKLSTTIALHHGLGLKAEALSAEDARKIEPALSEELEAAILRPEEASVDNRALTAAILEAARRSGVEVMAGNEVVAVTRDGLRCTGFETRNGRISAGHTVLAAGSFSAGIEGAARYTPVVPAKGQMVSLRGNAAPIERVLWSDKIYLVPRNDRRILAGATMERIGFDKTVTAGGVEKLLSAAIELAPSLASARIEETWAGLRPDSPDHLPILGPTDLDGLLCATGHFRSGILLTPITAKLIREWITQKNVSIDWDRFSPLRFQDFPAPSAKANSV